jgi:hypothetical protein
MTWTLRGCTQHARASVSETMPLSEMWRGLLSLHVHRLTSGKVNLETTCNGKSLSKNGDLSFPGFSFSASLRCFHHLLTTSIDYFSLLHLRISSFIAGKVPVVRAYIPQSLRNARIGEAMIRKQPSPTWCCHSTQ